MATEFDYSLHLFRSPQFQSVVEEAIHFFNRTPLAAFPPKINFRGAGVYAIYYLGNSEIYAELANCNLRECTVPIYVGKAVPPGWRIGRIASIEAATLQSRLREHARSIAQVPSLTATDFKCRFMILSGIETDLVVPIEAELIRRYQPLWNVVVDGFGNHDPGKGRYQQAPSEWDILHPGRRWVTWLTGITPDLAKIIRKVRTHLSKLDLA